MLWVPQVSSAAAEDLGDYPPTGSQYYLLVPCGCVRGGVGGT
jgi:hypothetical protein